ncbi:MAG TPA: SH3 domain-containing protein [Burkholderiales bacterium]|nr:SH3 domain-containing protein [Burkholderiales bacterium]
MKALVPLLFLPLIAWAEPATVIRPTDLKAEPASDAATVKQLAENTPVDALERKGGWTRVKAGSAEGWVKMLVLRYSGAGDTKRGDTGLTQAINVARTGSSGTQVTTGVRGLDEAQLAKAQPNPAELAKLDRYAADRDGATRFAEQGKLSATTVPYP